jgi:lipopolysaccharide/colanic/teichoic acid biosynthesis glycosyltransferase
MLLIAMLIKMVSPGPVLFKQKRVGYMGKTFFCWKFRTMGLGASTSLHQNYLSKLMNNEIPMAKLDDADKRIIPFGKFMRKSGLDELPQLFNVLCGEMSLIGPRPCIPYESRQFLNWQHKRFDAVPGITGLWQVNGKNMTTFNEMMRYDISYTKKKSLWLDIKILFKTLPVIIHQVSSLNRYPKFGSSHGRGQREPQHQ